MLGAALAGLILSTIMNSISIIILAYRIEANRGGPHTSDDLPA